MNRKFFIRSSLILLLLCTLFLFGCSGQGSTSETSPDDTVIETESGKDTTTDDSTSESADITEQGDLNNTPVPDWEEDGILKILTIGNSFSDDTMQYVYDIAQDLKVKNIKLGNLYIGGCSLDTHASNAREDKSAYEYRTNTAGAWSTVKDYKMSDAIRSENWDFISLQQASGSSGIVSTYSQLEYMIGYVRSLCPTAKLVWNMTWAYQQDTTHSAFSKYNSDQTVMYNAILTAVEKKIRPREEIHAISPTGTAIQNARSSYVGDRLTRDGYHLSLDFGRYVAGLTFLHKLTGLSIDSVSFAPSGVDENMQKIAIESAVNAVAQPSAVTNSAYTTEPALDESKYTRLELGWVALGYWNSSSAANHHKIIKTASNSKQFYATGMFTRDELPVGSVIILADGWKYRPEGWKSEGVQTSRPALTSIRKVTVTEDWWSDYTYRAFNLAKEGNPSLANAAGEIEAAFTILVPKK